MQRIRSILVGIREAAICGAEVDSDDVGHRWLLDFDFRWHIEILPRLYFRGGVELATGCWLNNVWPEVAAAHLRAIELSE